jgi:hypothetical protein
VPHVLVEDFKESLSNEIAKLDGGILLAAEMTGVSDRGLRRILSGKQKYVSDTIFDRICTAFGWEYWSYEIHGIKDP